MESSNETYEESKFEIWFRRIACFLMGCFVFYMLCFGGCENMFRDMGNCANAGRDHRTGKLKSVTLSFDNGLRFDVDYYGLVDSGQKK